MKQTTGGKITESEFAGDRGQTTIFVLLALALFLLGFVGFAVDISNLWWHRQMAQTAADSACVAGAMDVFAGALSSSSGFTVGTAFDCASTSGAVPCKYAAFNGYNGAGLTAGASSNDVAVSFPSSVPGLTAPVGYANPYLRVDLVDRVPVYFSALLSGSGTLDVRAFAVCGVVSVNTQIPIIVLHPTLSKSFQMSGSTNIAVIGGTSQSIQVNSTSTTATSITGGSPCGSGGGPTIDFCYGGTGFCGSNFGVTGAQSAPSSGNLYTSCPPPSGCVSNPPTCSPTQRTPQWKSQSPAIPDPFANLPAPTQPGTTGGALQVAPGTNGCPLPLGSTSKCDEYHAGYYASGITVQAGHIAIFDPGVYYLAGNFTVSGSGVVRPSNATGDGSGGTMFYFKASAYPNISGGGTLNLTQFNTSVVTCPGGPAPDPPLPNLIPSVAGSQPQPQILLAPCTGTYGDPSGQYRGMLFFQDHTANGTKPNLSGGSGLVLVGDMYFHASNWSSLLTLSGSSASTSFSYGSIVTDQLNLTGGGTINMVLSPSQLATVSKVSLLR